MRGDLCPFDHGADPVVVEEAHLPSMLAYGPTNTNTPPQIPPGPGPGPRPQGKIDFYIKNNQFFQCTQ